ncbi:30S ribosomal protein S8 [Pseudomonadota bacterium]
MTDPIADMLTRVRNGLSAQKVAVEMPGSRVKSAIAKVLKDEGYIKDFDQSEREGKPLLTVALKYYQGQPVIRKLKRESKPGLRVYANSGDLPTVLGGLGVAIISTSKGIMTDRQARQAGVGGEVLCSVS